MLDSFLYSLADLRNCCSSVFTKRTSWRSSCFFKYWKEFIFFILRRNKRMLIRYWNCVMNSYFVSGLEKERILFFTREFTVRDCTKIILNFRCVIHISWNGYLIQSVQLQVKYLKKDIRKYLVEVLLSVAMLLK